MDMATAPDPIQHHFTAGAQASSDETMRVLSAQDISDPAFIQNWQRLALNASEPNPFFEPWFLQPSLDQFRASHTIRIKAFYSGGQLRGLMPITRTASYYGYPISHAGIWLHENSFCGAPLVMKGFEHAFWRAALEHFDAHPDRALFLHLPQMPADGPINASLDVVLQHAGRRSFIVDSGERAMLASSASPNEYLAASMSAKKRKELRRQRNRLSEMGELAVERSLGQDGLADWIAQFLTLEAAGWKGNAGSALASAEATRSFFVDTLTQAARAGRLERLSLTLDGNPIAMLANFVTPPGVFSFKTTFDEAYARFSPGLLLQVENLDLLARGDIAWADSCAAQGHSMIERIWREKRCFISRNIAIGGPLRRLTFNALMQYETRGRSAP